MSDIDTRNQIITEAKSVFARYGYKRANLEDIASRLGKGKSFIYYYFKNKEEIYTSVIKKETDRLLQELSNTAETDEGIRVKLKNFILVKAEILKEEVNYSRIINEGNSAEKAVYEKLIEDFDKKEFDIICSIFKSGIDSGELKKIDPQWIAGSFLTAMKGFESQQLIDDSLEEINSRAEALIELIFFGIASDEVRKKSI